MKTQVCIVGGGPSGLLLSQLLNRAGIDTVVLERASRAHVMGRIRAGVLEAGTVALLREAGVAGRLDREGIAHEGFYLSDEDMLLRIDLQALTGKSVLIYGQTEVTADLYAAQDAMGTEILDEVQDVVIHDAATRSPFVEFVRDGARQRIDCRFVVGCDGFHGVSRATMPAGKVRAFERVYPFGWLGLLSKTSPVSHEIIYANSRDGFALASLRSATLSRYYVQVSLTDKVAEWSDDRFWEAFQARLPREVAGKLQTGPSLEKSIAPLRSFVHEPLRWGSLFLVGDAAHIVPPTGAKGLNLAVSDVFYLHTALRDALARGDARGIDAYSERALQRIWKAMRFSWQMTTMLHRFDGEDAFAPQMRKATLAHLAQSETARKDLAENYVGLPF